MFGQVIESPWENLRGGLVLGGEALWRKAHSLIAQVEGDEEIRWTRRADAKGVARIIDRLVSEEEDRRVAIWLRVRLGGERMMVTATVAECIWCCNV